MDTSLNLITAQISFLEGHFALIHIPLPYYQFFLQPIQRLLFGEDHDEDAYKLPWPYRHSFLNVSITPVECSVICSRELAHKFFGSLVGRFNDLVGTENGFDHVQISREDFNVIQVDGQGLDAGQRVLELTSPLALAGIPIFFQTTYFSDYILVPQKSIRTVTKTLEERGFTFSPSAAAYVSQHSPSSPISPRRTRQSGSGNPFDFPSTLTARPNTPPASNINELQAQTFAKLRRAGIIPTVDRSIRLVSCAARRETNPALDAQLRNDLLQILLATCPETRPHHATETKASAPDFSTRFLSLTLTSEEPISLLLESFLLSNPNLSLSSTLLFSQLSSPSIPAEEAGSGGTGKDVLIPITLDLRDLPLDATGIVCGVAGRLAQGTASQSPPSHPLDPSGSKARQSSVMGEEGDEEEGSLSPKTSTIETVLASQIAARPGPGQVDRSDERHDATVVVEISFLSTARAGTVIVRERELERAIRALDAGAEMVHLDHNGGEGGSQAER